MKQLLPLLLAVSLILAASIQKCEAQIWKPLGQGFEQIPVAITTTPDNIYFAFVDSTTLGNNAKLFYIGGWNGFIWQTLTSFVAGQASQLTSIYWYKNKLYAGGFFDTVLLTSSRTGLLIWDGKNWANAAKRRFDDASPIRINDMEVLDGYLYAAGAFSRIDTTRANGIARFDGFKWETIDGLQSATLNGIANTLEIFNDTLFVGGNYKNTTTTKPIPLFKIKGKKYTADSTLGIDVIKFLKTGANELMAFGDNVQTGKLIKSYKNNTWVERLKGFPNLQTAVFANAEFHNGEFWVCGLVDIGGKTNSIIKWTDTSWIVLDNINIPSVRFLSSFKSKLYASGNFTNFRRIRLNHIAEFDENFAIIAGRAFIDANNNCKFDTGEKPAPGQVMRLWNGLQVNYTDKDGFYSFVVPKSGTYQISTLVRKYWLLSSCNPNQYSFQPTQNQAILDSADFAIRLDPTIQDINVKIIPNTGNSVRKGYTEVYTLLYRNNGGKTINNGKISLKIDDSIKNFIALPPPSTINNGVAEWNFTNLEAGQLRAIYFRGKVNNGNANKINFVAEAISSNDAFTGDNFDSLNQRIEDITELKGKYIFPEPEKDDSITMFPITGQRDVEYLIRFENKTTDTITTVVVIDTIDLNLSLDYIQEMGASHNYTTQVINLPPQLGKGLLIWTFANIKLPPAPANANDFTDNRGHIRFKLRLSPNTPIGTLITNKASILYDYTNTNTTNKVFCMVDNTIGLQETNNIAHLSLFPNPAGNTLTIATPFIGNYSCTVTDMQGRVCLPPQLSENSTTQLNIESLEQGIYFLQSTQGSTTLRSKFIKQ